MCYDAICAGTLFGLRSLCVGVSHFTHMRLAGHSSYLPAQDPDLRSVILRLCGYALWLDPQRFGFHGAFEQGSEPQGVFPNSFLLSGFLVICISQLSEWFCVTCSSQLSDLPIDEPGLFNARISTHQLTCPHVYQLINPDGGPTHPPYPPHPPRLHPLPTPPYPTPIRPLLWGGVGRGGVVGGRRERPCGDPSSS